VAVIPGREPSDCVAAGFTALAPAYRSARARVAKVERRILAIEASADCIAPGKLVHEVQRVLDRSGWTGWTVRARSDRGDGPCGSVSYIAGNGRRYISWNLDADGTRVFVARGAGRRITDLLYSADRSLLVPLFAESGARCFTFDGLRQRVRQVFGAEGVDASVMRTSLPRNTALDDDDGRWTRYRAGCAVLAAGEPGKDADSVVIGAFIRP
jgi:hypothetical protein